MRTTNRATSVGGRGRAEGHGGRRRGFLRVLQVHNVINDETCLDGRTTQQTDGRSQRITRGGPSGNSGWLRAVALSCLLLHARRGREEEQVQHNKAKPYTQGK